MHVGGLGQVQPVDVGRQGSSDCRAYCWSPAWERATVAVPSPPQQSNYLTHTILITYEMRFVFFLVPYMAVDLTRSIFKKTNNI
jgi:hypothetical protein